MGDPNTPNWLTESVPETEAPPTSVAPPPPPAPGAASASSTDLAADDADLPGVILTMRLANMGIAVALVVVAVRAWLLCDGWTDRVRERRHDAIVSYLCVPGSTIDI
jgi:hypothetical protein